MKTKGLILIVAVLLCSSCIVKSLQPFYTKDSLSFNEKLLGRWTDNKKGQWDVKSFEDAIKDSTKVKKISEINNAYSIEFSVKFEEEDSEVSDESTELDELLKKGYLVKYTGKNKETLFVAMPFKINNQYFLDLIPFMYEDESVNNLVNQHLLPTHSLAKVDVNSDNEIAFSWLNEDKVKDLFENQELRLKHEQIGYEEDLLLTASSEELFTFLKKYKDSDIEDKWKSSDKLILTKTNAKP